MNAFTARDRQLLLPRTCAGRPCASRAVPGLHRKGFATSTLRLLPRHESAPDGRPPLRLLPQGTRR